MSLTDSENRRRRKVDKFFKKGKFIEDHFLVYVYQKMELAFMNIHTCKLYIKIYPIIFIYINLDKVLKQ